jgi:hypothetical protein
VKKVLIRTWNREGTVGDEIDAKKIESKELNPSHGGRG